MEKSRKNLFKFAIIATLFSFIIFGTAVDSFAITLEGKWKHNKKGWWYEFNDGNYAAGWMRLGKKWYFFNAEGYMYTGWKKSGKNWYYLGSDGMATGWTNVKGSWYYFQNNGIMKTGWFHYDGKWYYLGDKGDMKTGWVKYNGNWYYFGNNGDMKTGWQTVKGKTYYFKSSGMLATGEVTIGERIYIFDRDGDVAFMIDEEGLFTMNENLFGRTYERVKYDLCLPKLEEPVKWDYWRNNLTVTYVGEHFTFLFQNDKFVMAMYDFPEEDNIPPGLMDSAAILWGKPFDDANYYDDVYHYTWILNKFKYEQYVETYALTGEKHFRQRYISDMYD